MGRGTGRGTGTRRRSAGRAASAHALALAPIDLHSRPVAPAAQAAWEAAGPARQALATQRALARRDAIERLSELWLGCVANRPELYQPVAPSLQAPPEVLQRWWNQARQLSYDYHCVLASSPATFGIEIECIGPLEPLARALKAAGLSVTDRVVTENIPDSWVVKEDHTVAGGGEIVSPVLRDEPRAWQDLERVCALLRRRGYRVDETCGLHVHVGADRLDMSGDERQMAAAARRLLDASVTFEDLLYRLGAADGAMRHRGVTSAFPWSARALAHYGYTVVPDSLAAFKELVGPQHIDVVNFERLGHADDATVEFRVANGTIDELQIQALVTLFVGLVEFARKPAPAPVPLPQQTPLGFVHQRGGDAQHRLVRALLDAVFPRDQRGRLRVLWLYQRSRWQPPAAVAPGPTAEALSLAEKLLARKRAAAKAVPVPA